MYKLAQCYQVTILWQVYLLHCWLTLQKHDCPFVDEHASFWSFPKSVVCFVTFLYKCGDDLCLWFSKFFVFIYLCDWLIDWLVLRKSSLTAILLPTGSGDGPFGGAAAGMGRGDPGSGPGLTLAEALVSRCLDRGHNRSLHVSQQTTATPIPLGSLPSLLQQTGPRLTISYLWGTVV